MIKEILFSTVSALWALTVFGQTFNRTYFTDANFSTFIWQLDTQYPDKIISNVERVCSNNNLCINLMTTDKNGEFQSNNERLTSSGFYNRMKVRHDTIFYSGSFYSEKDSITYWYLGMVNTAGDSLAEYKIGILHLKDTGLGSFGYQIPGNYGLALVNNNEAILWGEGLDNRQPNPGKVPYRSVFLRVGLDGSRKGDHFWFDVNDEKPRRMSEATTDIDGNMVFHYEWRNKLNNGNVNLQKRGIFKILPNDSIINIAHVDVGQLDHDRPKIAIDKSGNYFINTLDQGFMPEYGMDKNDVTFLSKIDRKGSELWRIVVPPYIRTSRDFFTDDIEMRRISTTKNGDILCTGRVSVLDSFFNKELGINVRYSSLYCSFIARFDTDGNLLWRHFIVPHKKDGSIRNNYIYDIQEAVDGSIITGGQLERDDDLPGGRGDAWLMRLSPDGCLNDSCDHIGKYWDFPSEIVSVFDSNVATNLTTYPNPGQNLINITLPQDLTLPIQYQITDINGRTHETGTQYQRDITIDAAYLPSGMFNILIQDKTGKIWHGRWVKRGIN